MSQENLITIDVDAELQAIMQKLKRFPDQVASPSILGKALTTAARRSRTHIVKDVKKQYAISDASVLKDKSQGAPFVESAKASDLTATIKSCGPMLDVMKFLTKPNNATGAAAAKVLSASSLKMLEADGRKAFVATFSNGHVAIAQRRGQGSLPLKKILSPSVPHMTSNEQVRAQAEEVAYSYLQKAIAQHIDNLNNA